MHQGTKPPPQTFKHCLATMWARLCMHQGTKSPPQAFKHCVATMRARGRKQGSLARDNNLAAMYSTPTQVMAKRRECSVCEMMGGGSSAMTFFGHQPLSETADCLFMLPTPISAPCGENAFFKIKIDDSSPESSKRSRDGSISVSCACDTVCGIHDAPACVVPLPCALPPGL